MRETRRYVRRVRRPSRGLGVFFVIILAMVMLVAFIGMFQMVFSQQVVDQVTKSSLGEVALTVAESAAAEAMWQVRRKVNDPEDPLFVSFRGEVFAKDKGDLSIDVDLPETEKLLAQPHYRRYYLDDFTAKVAWQRQFSQVPYEKFGVITCRATVGTNLSLTERVVRTIEVGSEFKVALLGPPRPFDQVTFLVAEAGALVRDADYRVRESVRDFDGARADREALVAALDAERSRLRSVNPDEAIAALQRVDIPTTQRVQERVHEFEEPLTVFTIRETVGLKDTNLPTQLTEASQAIADLANPYRRSRDRAQSNLDSVEAQDTYRSTLERWIELHQARINAVASFQELFTEYSGASRNELADFFYKLDLPEWRAKAFWTLREEPGRDVNKQLDELRKKLTPLNGVVFVENPSQPLDLEGQKGTFEGRVVLVATGNVRLGGPAGAAAAAGANDLLSVVSFGAVAIDGECRCSVVANQRISVSPSATLHGNLIVRELREPNALQGSIIKDPRLYSGRTVPGDTSGAFLDYYYVAVGPGETYRAIERR